MNILLIDDEPVLIRDILLSYDYDVDVALDGYQGLRCLHSASKQYDLVILDIQMPVLDGWELLAHIREEAAMADLYVLMLTANNMERSNIRGLKRGADLYLTKPITPGLLIANLNSIERRQRITSKKRNEGGDRNSILELLTVRENEILSLVVKGLSNREIATKLFLSETTIKNHLGRAFKKLNVDNRTQAAFLLQKYTFARNL